MRRIDWFAATSLLLFAAALRILGISYGNMNPAYFPSYVPYGMLHEQAPIQPDEFFSVAIPANMTLRNTYNPEFFNYPSFIINVNLVLNQVTGALDGLSLADRAGRPVSAHAGFSLYVFTRMYSVFGGMLQVACAYAISRLAAGRFAAICAGLLVAVSYTLVQHAHYAKPGSLAVGWMMLAAWACFASLSSRGNNRRITMWLLACAVSGIAVTTRYNALAIAPLVACVGSLLICRHRSRSIVVAVFLGMLLAPLAFIVGSPYVLLDFEHFWRDFSLIVGQYTLTGEGVPEYFLVDHWAGLGYLVMYSALFALGLPALVMAGLSLIAAWTERPRRDLLRQNTPSLFITLVAIVVLLYALVALRTVRPGHSDQLLILVLPFVAVLSAGGADWLNRRLKLPARLTMPVFALALVAQPLVLSVQVVRMFSQPDTRHIMLEWIHDNIHYGARFYINGPYNVPLDAAVYPNDSRFGYYTSQLLSGDAYDYMIYADARAFDVLRSHEIVPPDVVAQQRDYLDLLDSTYLRVAHIDRPSWTGSTAMINMAAYWHNPMLILYCVNAASCADRD